MNLTFSKLDDARIEEAFEILKQVSDWLESIGRRQRISNTTFESYSQWQSEKANFSVTCDTQLIGLVTLRSEPLEEWPKFASLGQVLMLRALATHPDFQGRGVGAFALRKSISAFGMEQAIYLDCVSDSLPHYYSKFGFKSIDRQVRIYPDGESFDITLMKRSPS